MQALRQAGFPVPNPIAQNRHVVLMSLVDAFPLRQIVSVPDPPLLYAELMEMIVRLAGVGLIHGDFNEFNILVEEKEKTPPDTRSGQRETSTAEHSGLLHSSPEASSNTVSTLSSPRTVIAKPSLIDFPQMLSVDHPNASTYFARDVDCVKSFFTRKFRFTSDEEGPFFEEAKQRLVKDPTQRLDVAVEASGFSRKMAKELEGYMDSIGVDGDHGVRDREDDEEGSEESDGEDDGGETDGEEKEGLSEKPGRSDSMGGENKSTVVI